MNSSELYLKQRDIAYDIHRDTHANYIHEIEIIHDGIKKSFDMGYEKGYEQGYIDALKSIRGTRK